MNGIDAGFRGLVDALAGGSPDDGARVPDEPDDLEDAPFTRASYRLACNAWRRKPETARYRIRGSADLLLLQAGIVFYGVSIWINAQNGDIGAKFPSRVTLKGDGPPSATFRDTHSKNAFARRAWEAVLFGFPNAESSPIGEMLFREQT